MKIRKINFSDIEDISEKKSFGVSKKFSIWIFLWAFWIFFILAIWFFINLWNPSWISANLIWENLNNLSDLSGFHWSSEIWKNIIENNYKNFWSDIFSKIYIFLTFLFWAIYVLYIFAKIELQKFWEQWISQWNFATKNFPSIYILETMTMLYVIIFVVLWFLLIQQIDFTIAFKTMNSAIETSAIFSLFWWALSSLFYFLHKVRPWKFDENWKEWEERKVDFDINRVLKYLSFPFMSAWMWVISYLIIMWIWDIFWIDVLKNPSENFVILLALMAWYFCDAFVIFFHSIFKWVEEILNKKINKKINKN